MPATTSATTGSALPPPPRRVESQAPRDAPSAQNVNRSAVPGRTPIMVSNDEILTLFGTVQDQMKQQQKPTK